MPLQEAGMIPPSSTYAATLARANEWLKKRLLSLYELVGLQWLAVACSGRCSTSSAAVAGSSRSDSISA